MQSQNQNLIGNQCANSTNLGSLIIGANQNQNSNPNVTSPNNTQANKNAQINSSQNQAISQNLYLSSSPNNVNSAVQQLQSVFVSFFFFQFKKNLFRQLYATDPYLTTATGQPLAQVMGYQVTILK